MEPIDLLERIVAHLRDVVAAVPDDRWSTASNCEPWTADVLLAHALNSQLMWISAVTGDGEHGVGDVMNPVARAGDQVEAVDEVAAGLAAWRAEGTLERAIDGPFGTLPGSETIVYPSIDALLHSWDLAISTGVDATIPDDLVDAGAGLAERAINDVTRQLGLFAEPAPVPDDATSTERLVATAGRAIPR